MHAYQLIRKPRAEQTQAASKATGDTWHLPDGPEQEMRDSAMKAAMKLPKNPADLEGSSEKEREWVISNPNIFTLLYGYDAVEDVGIL
jgi:salicylate hydroxylase